MLNGTREELHAYVDDLARGVIAGLTRFANRGHIARAALEAIALQVLNRSR